MATDGGITPRLLLTKCDLAPEAEVERLVESVRREHAFEVAAVSGVTGAGWVTFAGPSSGARPTACRAPPASGRAPS
jgi:putative ribosome biogenesis GTPase RsgA